MLRKSAPQAGILIQNVYFFSFFCHAKMSMYPPPSPPDFYLYFASSPRAAHANPDITH